MNLQIKIEKSLYLHGSIISFAQLLTEAYHSELKSSRILPSPRILSLFINITATICGQFISAIIVTVFPATFIEESGTACT